MSKQRKNPDRILAKGLVISLLGMGVYTAGQLEGRAAAQYTETKPVVLYKKVAKVSESPLAKYVGNHGYTAQEREELARLVQEVGHSDFVATLAGQL